MGKMYNMQEVPQWLLDERACHLSGSIQKEAERAGDPGNREQEIVLAFEAGKTIIGIPVKGLQEVIKITSLTWVPSTPSFVRGVFQLLDGPVAALDLGVLLGFPSLQGDLVGLVISCGDKKAAILTRVFQQYHFSKDSVKPLPQELLLEIRKWTSGIVWIEDPAKGGVEDPTDPGRTEQKLIAIMDVHRFFETLKIQTIGGVSLE